MSRRLKTVERIFVGLHPGDYAKNSRETDIYNCIAFAAGDVDFKWDCCGDPPDRYWPTTHIGPMIEHLVSAYAAEGFEPCKETDREVGYEMVALYWTRKNRKWTHAARLRNEDGWWESKLGDLADIVHRTPQGLEGADYGQVALFMRRRTSHRLRFHLVRWLRKKKRTAETQGGNAALGFDIDAKIEQLLAFRPTGAEEPGPAAFPAP